MVMMPPIGGVGSSGETNKKRIERELWERYKRGDVSAARELYERMRPLVSSETNKLRNWGVPVPAIEAEARKWFAKALDEYDPSRGAELSTYVVNRLRRVQRFASKYQNVARLPENRAMMIKTYKAAKDHLQIVLGREPSAHELAEDLKWDLKEVQNMETSLRDQLSGFGLGQTGGEPELPDDPRTLETLRFLYYKLNNQEKLIMEYMLGWGGKPKLKGSEIAARVGISEASVSRFGKRLAKEFEKYH